MDRKDKRHKSGTSSSSAASMAALAAAAAAGEGADVSGAGGMAPQSGEEADKNPMLPAVGVAAVVGESSSSAAAAVAARTGGGSPAARARGGSVRRICQAERCGADLAEANNYNRRHKVCEAHAKAAVVLVAGLRQRFCQQCSRFHELSEFDDIKRSCRQRLAGHNQRRRRGAALEIR